MTVRGHRRTAAEAAPIRRRGHAADAVLLATLAQIETFAELAEGVAGSPVPYVATMREARVPYRPGAWFTGPLTAARRKAYSRAVERIMEDRSVSYRRARSRIRDGDLLLFRPRRGLAGRLIARAGRSDYSHAGMAAWWNRRLMCLETIQGRGGRAVRAGGVDPVPNLADRATEPGDLARSVFFRYRFTLFPEEERQCDPRNGVE